MESRVRLTVGHEGTSVKRSMCRSPQSSHEYYTSDGSDFIQVISMNVHTRSVGGSLTEYLASSAIESQLVDHGGKPLTLLHLSRQG